MNNTDAEHFEQFIENPALDQMVQRNTEYYRTKWRGMFSKAQSLKKMQTARSWNWPGFFLGGFWMLYRRMYMTGAIYLIGLSAISAVNTFTDWQVPSIILLVPYLLTGMYGTTWYFQHIYKRVTATSGATRSSGTAGVSWPAAITGTALFIAINIGIAVAGFGGFNGLMSSSPDGLKDVAGSAVSTPSASQKPSWEKYVGKHPAEFAQMPEPHSILQERLGDRYDQFAEGLGVSSTSMEIIGRRYLIGEGCTQNDCAGSGSFLSIDIIDGEIFAARMEAGWTEPLILTGADATVTDEVISRYDAWRREF